jgi:hypothetical protein
MPRSMSGASGLSTSDRDQLTLPQQVELILEARGVRRSSKVVVEANSYQAGLYQAIKQRWMRTRRPTAIEPHYTTRTNKPDPELGCAVDGAVVRAVRRPHPVGRRHSQRKMSVFVDELVMYPDSRTTDTVMAFWFAWRSLQISAEADVPERRCR